MKNNIYRSAAQVTAFSTVEKALSFVYRIILTRIIGAEGIGIYQICLTVFSVFLTVASSGVPVTVSRLMAKSNAKNDINGKHAAVTAGVLCTLLITVPVALVLFFGKSVFGFLFSDERCIQHKTDSTSSPLCPRLTLKYLLLSVTSVNIWYILRKLKIICS